MPFVFLGVYFFSRAKVAGGWEVVIPHINEQFSDTSRVSENSTQF